MDTAKQDEHYKECELLVSRWNRGDLVHALTVVEKCEPGWETDNMRKAIMTRINTGVRFFEDERR